MESKIIGRDSNCDYVIFDPKNRVSRRHLELMKNDNGFFLKDLNSLNGTFLNGKKISPGNLLKISNIDKITLSEDYVLDISKIFCDDDNTKVFSSSQNDDFTIVFKENIATMRDGQKTIVFDRDKTQLGDILNIEKTPYVTIGRNTDNNIFIDNINVSRYHCKMRLITPMIFEIEDLGSTNGTFSDNIKLIPNKKYQFDSSAKIRFGSSFLLNLKSIFPSIEIIQKAPIPSPENKQAPNPINSPLSKSELKAFNELEDVWKEYLNRQNQANNASFGYGITGSVIGIAASVFLAPLTGGASVLGLVASAGGGVLGRYLGQQKSSEIRNDLTYEDAFLQVYACPRCNESFQKKPWVTIRECYKCKVKFR